MSVVEVTILVFMIRMRRGGWNGRWVHSLQAKQPNKLYKLKAAIIVILADIKS